MSVQAVDTAVGRLFVDTRDSSLGKKLIRQGAYEPQWTAWYQRTITRGLRVIDVGANIGYYTVLFGRAVGPSGRVIACEPDPDNRDLLTRNVETNGVTGQVSIAGVALADRSGTMPLHRDPRRAGVHSLSAANLVALDGASRIDVPGLTLDALVLEHRLDGIDLIKMDAQGAEAMILRGARRTLASAGALTWVVEVWPAGLVNCGASVDELLEPFERGAFIPHLLGKGGTTPEAQTFSEIRRRAARLATPQSVFNAAFIRSG